MYIIIFDPQARTAVFVSQNHNTFFVFHLVCTKPQTKDNRWFCSVQFTSPLARSPVNCGGQSNNVCIHHPNLGMDGPVMSVLTMFSHRQYHLPATAANTHLSPDFPALLLPALLLTCLPLKPFLDCLIISCINFVCSPGPGCCVCPCLVLSTVKC